MIDERNINNIIELIETSNQKIKTIKETIEEQKSTFELPKNDFKNLSTCVEEVLKSKNFDNLQELFGNLNKNIAFKTDFLKEQYKNLDENIFKVQNIAKHIDKDISDDVNALVEIVETFSYKIKILQGIVSDISVKTTSFPGENTEKLLKDFRSDCGDFDEEFDQVLRELKQNFKKASDITAKLSKLDTGVDLSQELFTINVSINAIMSTLAVFDEKYKDLGKAFAESGLYTDFSAKIEDLSYNTKHLIRNIDNFNKVVEEGSNVKDQVASLEQRIETINNLIQSMNQEGLLEIKALLSSIDNSDDINEIKTSLNTLSSINQDEKIDAITEELKEAITSFNQDEKFTDLKESIIAAQGSNETLEEIKSLVSNLENIKLLGQFEFVLNEIQQGEKVSQEKLDELLKITSMVNFGEVEKEISFLSNDLEIISEEIKHSRSITEKNFSKMETIFESFNLMELKNRIFEFENYLKKFLKKEDLQLFASDLQAITEKFELANGVIIDGFDDIEALKTYIVGFDEKFADLTSNIQGVLAENQEKFDSAIEAFDTTYKLEEIANGANELMAQVTLSKTNILSVLNEGQEKLELLIKAIDSSDKFDEMQEVIKNNLDQVQAESNARIQELGEISKSVGDDMEALKASMLNIIRENQDKFDEMLSSLDSKLNNQEIAEKIDSIIESIEEQSSNNELQTVSAKLMDEVNNGKYLVIDTIRESQIKLEEFVASVDSAHRIEELKNITTNLHDEIFKTKDTVLTSLRDHQDRVELLIRALDDSDRIDEVNELTKTVYSEVIASKDALMATIRNNQAKIEEAINLVDVNSRIDDLDEMSQKILEEVKFAREITQNVGRSINPETLLELQNSIAELKNSLGDVNDSVVAVDVKLNDMADKTDVSMLGELVKERHEQLEYLIRAYDPTADISAIKESMGELLQQEEFDELKQKLDSNKDVVYELRSILEERTRDLELVMKSVENTDDINELRDILFTIDNEQKDIKNAMNFVVKYAESSEISDEISSLKDILFTIDNEQKDIRIAVETALKSIESADDINYLKGILIDMEQEQKDIKSAIDYVSKNSENKEISGDINEIRDLLIRLNNEQKDIKDALESVAKYSDVSSLKDSLNDLVSNDEIYSLNQKVDLNKDAIYELKDILEERTRNLELVMKSIENTDDINDLRDVLFKIENEQKDIKDIIEATLKTAENTDDIDYLKGILTDMEQEQKDIKTALEYIVKNTGNSDISADVIDLKGILTTIDNEQKDIKDTLDSVAKYSDVSALKDSLSDLVSNDEIYALNQKIDSNKEAMYELKAILEERTRNLELVMKSVENSDDINDLKDILMTIDNEQKDIRNTVDFIAKTSENSDISSDINELRNALFNLNNDQKEIKNAIELSLKSAENSDDINYLKGLLADMEQEQKDIKTALDYVVKVSGNSEVSVDISEIKDKLDELNVKDDLNEIRQKLEHNKDVVYELRVILEERTRNLELLMKSVETSDEISDLKDVLFNISSEQKDIRNTIDFIAKASENSEISADISEFRDALVALNNDQKVIKNAIDSALKSAENTDDINYLKGLLADMEYEQKAIKATIDQYLPALNNEDVKISLGIIENKIDSVSEIKDEIAIFEQDLNSIKSSFNGVLRQEDVSNTFETIYEIKNDVSGFSSNINSLRKELEAISGNKDIEEMVEQLENIQYIVKTNADKNISLVSDIESIDGKITELKSVTDLNYDLKILLNNIQEDQLALKAMISSMDDDETINAIKDQIKTSEYVIRDVVEANRAKEDIELLKHQIENLTQQIVVQVMQVFDNISFEQETQEIKDFVDESYSGVKNVLNVLKTNIERLLDAPKPIYIEELKQEIAKVAENLDNIGPEMSEYVSTITSLRVSLEELSKAKDMVNMLEQNISNVSIEVDEILRISRDISAQFDIIYTHNEAKEDFAKIRIALDNIIEKQQEQSDNLQKEDLKGGIDNVNLSINYINENLNEFLGEYRIFQDKLSGTMHNLESMASTFVQSDSINSEYKQGVSETFKALKKDFNGVISTVGNLYTDISKVTALTGEMLNVSAKDKAEILQNMQNVKEIIESSDIDKLKDNFSTIIFSINGFMNNVDEKFASIIEDTKGAYDFASENKEIVENVKASIVHILEWTNTATRDFTRIQGNIEAFRDVFEDSAEDIRQINEVKAMVADLDSALASRVEEVFDRQIQSKLDNQLLPEFELLDKKIEKKLIQKLAPIIESREQDKDDLRFVINNQLSEETASLKELIDVVEKNIVVKLQNGFEQIFNQDLDFAPIVDKIDSEFALVNDKIDDSLAKIDTELYQANVKIEDSLSRINDDFSSLSSNIEDGIDKISKNVKNINFAEVTYKLEQGFDEISQKIDDTNLPQVVSKIDDEFSAMNKKLDVDFFEMNKRVVDEFNLIEEKLDTRTENLLQNIEDSNGQLASEIGKLTNRIENKTDQTLGTIDQKLESQKDILVKNIEAVSGKLVSEISQITGKIANQADQSIDNLENIKTEIAQELVQLVDKFDDKNQLLMKNIEDASIKVNQDLLQTTGKLSSQSSSVLKNIEEAKEMISRLSEKSDTQSDDNMMLVLNNLEQAKESMLYLAKNLESSQNTMEKISENLESTKKDIKQEIKSISGNNVSSILGNINQSKDDIKLEFVQIVEKIDAQAEKLNSFEATTVEISKISSKIEDAKNELNLISGKLDAQTGLVVKNVEDSNSKLDKTLDQVTSKLENQSKTVLKNLGDNQKAIEKSMTDIASKIDTQTELVFNNLGESKVELDDISKKITAQSELMTKNIEESKEELEQELVQIIDKIDSQTENLSKAQDKKLKSFEEKLNAQENKIQSIDEKLDVLIERLNTVQALDLSEIVIALENRMGSLDDNIKKIVSFVDEE